MPENWSWRTRQLLTCRCVECCARCNAEGVSWYKLKMMLCVMMLPLVVVGCASKQSVSQCVKPPPPPAWIMQPPRLADTAERDYFTLRERLIIIKNAGRNPSILMSSADRVAISMGNSCNYCEQYTRASGINAKSNKTEQSIYECLLGFCFNNIFCAATNFGCIDSFLLPNSETKKWWVMVSFGATAAGLFWTVNVCWAHPVISRASAVASKHFFHGVIPDAFWSSQNRMCRKLNKP